MQWLLESQVNLLDAVGGVILAAIMTYLITLHFAPTPNKPAVVQQENQSEQSVAEKPTEAPKDSSVEGGATKSSSTPSFGQFDAETTLALIRTRRSLFPKVGVHFQLP